MPVTKEHHLVGRQVVYRAHHPDAEPEQGMVTSVNVQENIVFVNYGRGSTSQATSADDLKTLRNEPVRPLLHRGTGTTTAQLQACPADDFWFVVNKIAEKSHVEILLEKHDIRKKVRIIGLSDVLYKCRGSNLPIVVDHWATESGDMDRPTQEFLLQHMNRYNP